MDVTERTQGRVASNGIELSERCVADIARAAAANVETTRGVKAAVASFPVAAAE